LLLFATLPAFAQAPVTPDKIDIAGDWAVRVHEDAPFRSATFELGDYTGLPINAAARRREEAERLAAPDKGGLQQRVLVYAGLGDKDRTFEVLNRTTVLGPVRLGRALTFPELSFLRGDPRVKALRKKVGLPE